jgi:hypothetical protein
VYLEDGIAHRTMVRLPGATDGAASPERRPPPSRGESAPRYREG